MARHRRFTLEFKRLVVLDFLEKRLGLRELSRKHNLSRNLLSQWVRKYETVQLTDQIADAHRIAEYEGLRSPNRAHGQPIDDGNRLAEKRGAAGTPAQRRDYLQQFNRERPAGFSAARGCRTMKLARSTYYDRARRAAAREMALHERKLPHASRGQDVFTTRIAVAGTLLIYIARLWPIMACADRWAAGAILTITPKPKVS